MSVGLIVAGLLAVLAVVWAVCKMLKLAAYCGIAAVAIYCTCTYGPDLLDQAQTQIAPLVARAGSYF